MNGTELITFLSNNFSAVLTTVGAITGSLFTAIFLRHDTATKEFEKIKAGQFKETADALLQAGKMTYTEYYKANNFLSVARKADEYYSQTPHGSEKTKYDFDWFVRFYEAVGSISNVKMQEIWAHILAGEVDHPGSFSLRTIEILKNIGKKDAELFEKVCSCTIHSGNHDIVPNYDDYLATCGITYSEIMRLDELGLVNSSGLLVLKVRTTTDQAVVFNNDRLLVMIKPAGEDAVNLDVKQFPLTDVGRELYGVQDIATPDSCYKEFVKELSKNKKIAVEMHKVIRIHGDQIEYNPAIILNDDQTGDV